MRKSRAVIALLSAGLLVLAAVTPAAAVAGGASSEFGVTWRAPGWPVGISGISTFVVTDGMPGFSGRPSKPAASTGDTGSYTLTRSDGALTLEVTCVRVDASGWAEFAGKVTEATGPYFVDEVFLVSVKDGGPDGAGDEIGMKSHGLLSLDPNALKNGCYAALDDKQFGRKGVISAGDIAVD